MKKYNRKIVKMNTHARACTHTLILKVTKRRGVTETRTRIKEKKYLYHMNLTLMYCVLLTELQRKLSKMLKVTYIIMIMY